MGEEFEKLHHFLRDEEAALMSSIKEEEEEKSRKMKERMERIMDDIACLTDAIRETEEAMAVEDVIFLKVQSHHFKGTVVPLLKGQYPTFTGTMTSPMLSGEIC